MVVRVRALVVLLLLAVSCGSAGGSADDSSGSSGSAGGPARTDASTSAPAVSGRLAEALTDFKVIDLAFHQASSSDVLKLGVRTFVGEDTDAVRLAATEAVASDADEVYVYECPFTEFDYRSTADHVDGGAWRDPTSEAVVVVQFQLGPADRGLYPGCVALLVVEGASDAELGRLESAVADLTPNHAVVAGEACWNDHTDEGHSLPDPSTTVPAHFVPVPPGSIWRC